MASLLRFSHRLISQSPPSISLSLLRSFSLPSKINGSASEEDLHPHPFDQKNLPSDYNPSAFDPTDHRSPPSARVWLLVDQISSLTLSEVTELSSILMRKASIKEPPFIAIMNPGAAAASPVAADSAAKEEEEKPEKTVFELKLESFEAASKIKVIKEVRAVTELGLKEAKELVEKSPSVIRSGLSREEAEAIVEKMKGAGAKVVMV